MANRDNKLLELADAFGIATQYRDGLKREKDAPTETLLALLRALGAPGNPAQTPVESLQVHAARRAAQLLEPVVVAWDGRMPTLSPRGVAIDSQLELAIELESDETLTPAVMQSKAGYRVDERLPLGRHYATVRCQGREQSFWIIAAPKTCPRVSSKHWGLFAPTYALHSERSLGVGDLGDLRRLGTWMRGQGGSTLATLPLCAAFLDQPLEISPYAPVSRLFWNELYLDVAALPELYQVREAQERIKTTRFRNQVARLLATLEVDHKGAMSLKRSVLEQVASHVFSDEARWSELEQQRPDIAEYARFRAAIESGAAPDSVTTRELPKSSIHYHAYVQAAFEQQLRALQQDFETGPGLYLDVPVGVHRDGFDAWKYQDAFLPGVTAGAPPDALFTGGQNWGFSPAHPEQIRHSGYEYMYRYLRSLASLAGVLRVDHVMGLHRIFAIPDGGDGRDGTYVHFHSEEQWAILCLVAHQCGCAVVGEDLGTVPAAVRKAMDEHETLRMFVGLYSFSDKKKATLKSPQKTQVTSLGTHDTPTLAGFLEGRDIDERFKMGLLDEARKKKDHLERRQLREALAKKYGKSIEQIHRGLLKALAESDSPLVLATLEDFWSEAQPQNTPGTGADWPNWKRRMSRSLEKIVRSERIERALQSLQR